MGRKRVRNEIRTVLSLLVILWHDLIRFCVPWPWHCSSVSFLGINVLFLHSNQTSCMMLTLLAFGRIHNQRSQGIHQELLETAQVSSESQVCWVMLVSSRKDPPSNKKPFFLPDNCHLSIADRCSLGLKDDFVVGNGTVSGFRDVISAFVHVCKVSWCHITRHCICKYLMANLVSMWISIVSDYKLLPTSLDDGLKTEIWNIYLRWELIYEPHCCS